jgi:hypothetical protein
MTELRWPHRATPRQVQSIADKEVLLWEMRQHERRDPEATRPARPPADGARYPRRQEEQRSFRYWSEALVDELTRVMVAKTDADASSGFVEALSNFVEHPTDPGAREGGAARGRKHWFHRGAPRKTVS